MHPIVSQQIAKSRVEDLHRQAAVARRAAPARSRQRLRLVLASAALGVARALDREGRVVPAVVTR